MIYDVLKADLNGAEKRALIEDFDKVLSLSLLTESETEETEEDPALVAYVEEMIEKRKNAKKEKNFALADEIRAELLQKGIVLKDTREGTLWEKQ